MSIIPILTPRELLSVLLKAGFKIIRQKGSHIRIAHPITGKTTTIAMHAKDFSRNMTLKILRQAGISTKEFLKLLGKRM
jgi:predicted RNA binding protein YcfA (HicA-like mRNA interferase family)